MRPVQVAIDVPQQRDAVFDYLDVLANHEQFTDHMLKDWEHGGPAKGVGSKARVKAVLGGTTDIIDVEVIAAETPVRTVERNVGAGGQRVATGTYTLAQLADGGTRITFEYAWQKAPLTERLAAPVVRAVARRAYDRAMRRLAEQLQNGNG